MKNIIFILSLAFCSMFFIKSNAQVLENKDEYKHTFYIADKKESTRIYTISFYKKQSSDVKEQTHFDYTNFRYYLAPMEKVINQRNLKVEARYIDSLLTYIQKNVPEFDLKNFEICTPLCWEDVLKKHIDAITKSAEWKKNGVRDKTEANPDLLNKIMIENDVYYSLNKVLRKHGYKIDYFALHKIGLYGPKTFKRDAGFDYKGSIYIPIPAEFGIFVKPTE